MKKLAERLHFDGQRVRMRPWPHPGLKNLPYPSPSPLSSIYEYEEQFRYRILGLQGYYGHSSSEHLYHKFKQFPQHI